MQGSTLTDSVSDVEVGFSVPIILLLNYSLFQYLFTTYFSRRHESRVRLLIFIAFISFASLVPFALRDPMRRRNLKDISEVCSVLTFLMQIVIITRDVSKRMKLKEILRLMWCAEVLVLLCLSVLILNVIDLFEPVIDLDLVELIDNIAEHIALVYVVCFRFYFLVMAKGLSQVLKTQKMELVVYTMFLTHEVPFLILGTVTSADLHHFQGLWMRVTIVMCLGMTIWARRSSQNSAKRIETGAKIGPGNSSFYPEKTTSGPPLPVSSTRTNDNFGPVVPPTAKARPKL